MTESSEDNPLQTEKIPVGECPDCGYVSGDDVEYRFPNPSKCGDCGTELEKTTMATRFQINRLQEGSA